jgi:NAD(P)-dependent dehydrogenase (short-subunit alcohol dehydrogenase family)
VLVNNAAASLQTREITPEGFERHWATKVLGLHLLTTLLLPALQASGVGRIVTVSTVAAGGLDLPIPGTRRGGSAGSALRRMLRGIRERAEAEHQRRAQSIPSIGSTSGPATPALPPADRAGRPEPGHSGLPPSAP